MAPTSQSKSGRRARPDNVPVSGAPLINGTAQVGETLTADTTGIEDGNGLDRVQFQYQWTSNDGTTDADIAGATDSGYTLVSDDVGRTIRVRVAFTDRGGYSETRTSVTTGVVAAAPNNSDTGTPAITGTARVGEMLTADTSGITDDDGLVNATYSYQWVANDGTTDTDISGATDATYTLVDDDEGQTIKVRVTIIDDVGNEATLTSAATEAVGFAVQQQGASNSAATGAPKIKGTARVGEMLTADTSGIADADGLTNATYSYQWVGNDGSSDTDIAGETDASYTLVADDEGKTIKVKVSFKDDADNDETLTSAATEAVAARPNQPATGKPTIGGTAQVRETLTADTSGIADADGLTNVSYNYQWVANDGGTDADISGETDAGYTLVADDVGKTIKVKVSFKDDADNQETLTSAATAEVDGIAVVWLPDNEPGGATNLGDVTSFIEDHSVNGTVSEVDDKVDYYRFSLTGSRRVELRLTSSDSDANLFLEGNHSVLLDSSVRSGLQEDSISIDLAAGTYFVRVQYMEGAPSTSYTLTYRTSAALTSTDHDDDYPANAETTGLVLVGSSATGNIDFKGDRDWFQASFTAGQTYRVDAMASGSGHGSLSNADLGGIYRSSGARIALTSNEEGGRFGNARTYFTPVTTGDYYIEVMSSRHEGAWPSEYEDTGTYTVAVSVFTDVGPDDFANFTDTEGAINIGGTVTGTIDAIGDHDWIAMELESGPGHFYELRATDSSNSFDSVLHGIYDSSGLGLEATDLERRQTPWELPFAVDETGTYFASIGVNEGRFHFPVDDPSQVLGDYTLRLDRFTARQSPLVMTEPACAAQRINTRFELDEIQVNLTAGSTYRVSLSGLIIGIYYNWGIYDPDDRLIQGSRFLTRPDSQSDPRHVVFTASASGRHRIFVSGGGSTSWYELCVDDLATPEPPEYIDLGPRPMPNPPTSDRWRERADNLGDISRVGRPTGYTPGWRMSTKGSYRYFRFFIPKTRTVHLAYPIHKTRTQLRLESLYGEILAVSEPSDSGEFMTLTLPAENYFVRATLLEDRKNEWLGTLLHYTAAPDLSADATLSGFELEDVGGTGITLTPAFDLATYVYTASVANNVDTVTLRATKSDAAASVAVLTESGSSTPDEATVDLAVGDNLIKAMVTSEDGAVSLIYMVTVTRSGPAAQQQAPNSPATGAPAISGTVQVGETLTVNTSRISDADGLDNVAYSYQWLSSRDTEILGATNDSYALVSDDEGKALKVKVSFKDDADNDETLTSAATAAVEPEPQPDSPATGQPTISGTARVGEMLTADTSGIADDDGLVNATYSYQWLGDDTDIAGATSSTYTLLAGDEGQTIKVRVVVTDDEGNETTLTSTATAAVAAPQPPAKPTGLSAAAVSHDAVTLTWDDPQDDSITGYVILRRDRAIHPTGTFVTITDDTGSTDTTYTDDTVEPDKEYVYRIKASNEHGEVSEESHWVRGFTPAVPVPDKPTGLSAAVSHDAVALTWDDPQDDSITGYVILRRDREIHLVGTFITITDDTGSADTTYTDETVEPDKEYVYRIKAINEHGEVSEESHWVRGFTPAAPAPAG